MKMRAIKEKINAIDLNIKDNKLILGRSNDNNINYVCDDLNIYENTLLAEPAKDAEILLPKDKLKEVNITVNGGDIVINYCNIKNLVIFGEVNNIFINSKISKIDNLKILSENRII